jgi:hypothetical protein
VDDEPRVSINDVTKAEGKKGKTTLFTFTVTLSAPYDQPVSVSFQTADGTATTGDNDYVARAGTLTFAPGETAKTTTVEVKGDNKREADETFCLDLFGNSGSQPAIGKKCQRCSRVSAMRMAPIPRRQPCPLLMVFSARGSGHHSGGGRRCIDSPC